MGPGFDTLGIALDIQNESIITESRFTSISVKGSGENDKKLKKDNLFVKIFYETYNSLCDTKRNFRFQFNNNIPISRGLGSSSAVIIGAIGAAYVMSGNELNKQDILNRAFKYELHPDNITPATVGGFTVSLEKDGKILYKKVEVASEVEAIVVIPDNPISTRRSRAALPKKYAVSDVTFNISRTALITAAFYSRDWKLLREVVDDRIHQIFRMRMLPELFEVRNVALQNGALMSTLSGSGSTFFNLAYKEDARSLKERLEDRFPHFEVKRVPFDNEGLRID